VPESAIDPETTADSLADPEFVVIPVHTNVFPVIFTKVKAPTAVVVALLAFSSKNPLESAV
jgi:hypothetical protein